MMGYLILKDGSVFQGEISGYWREITGEVVFTTALTGYTRSLTDPSYCGQILTFTYPLIGNWGVLKNKEFESNKIQVKAVVVSEVSLKYSHYGSYLSFNEWCYKNKVPIIQGINTRALAQKLRNSGTMMGGIFFQNEKTPRFPDISEENLVEKVSAKTIRIWNDKEFKNTVLLIDCGAKKSIIDNLVKRKARVLQAPWNFDFKNLKTEFDGVVISNGPGNPKIADITIQRIKELLNYKIPILGICLGHQLLGLAFGADTYKLKFGHRSLNQPVVDKKTEKNYITSQNHGYAINPKTLPKEVKVWFENLNDNTCEGIYHIKKPIFSVQFHPEGSPGPKDTEWIFDKFINIVSTNKIC